MTARKTITEEIFCKVEGCPRSSKPFKNNYDLREHEATAHQMHEAWLAQKRSERKRRRDHPKCRLTDCPGNGIVFNKSEWKQHCSDNPKYHGSDSAGKAAMIKSELEQHMKANPDIYCNTPYPKALHIEIPPDADEFEAKRNEEEERKGDESAEMLDLGDDRVLSRNAMRYCKFCLCHTM